MLVKILNKFNSQAFPLDETAIEVEQEVLDLIGVKYCFDVENNMVIDYDNTEDLKRQENQERIAELRAYLNNTWSWQWERYNAETIEIEMGIREEYTITRDELILKRKECVDEINSLEKSI